jgi:hypothetical protein
MVKVVDMIARADGLECAKIRSRKEPPVPQCISFEGGRCR